MINKLSASYLAPPYVEAVGYQSRLRPPAGSRLQPRSAWASQGVKVVAAALIEAFVIVGLVVSSLGIGAEGHAGVRPYQPPHLVAPIPGPAPTDG